VTRRSRLAFLDRSLAYQALPGIVDAMGEEFGWDNKKKDSYLKQNQEFFMKMEF